MGLLASIPAFGQSVQQSGHVTVRHGAIWSTNGVVKDAGGAAGGPAGSGFSEIGITNTGLPFCINDAPINQPYHQLCLGANVNNHGALSYNAYAGALPFPLFFDLNGTDIPIPGTVTGLPFVANNATLLVLSTTLSNTVYRAGFITPGDGGSAYYNLSSSPCSLNGGNGDNGSQVKASNGNCWIADFKATPANILQWGADKTGNVDTGPMWQAAYTANVGCITIPEGIYYINTSITISAQPPCFKGVFWSENNENPSSTRHGSWIRIDNTTITPFSISSSTTAGSGRFTDLAVEQTQPNPGPGWVPTNYNYVWSCVGTGGELQLDNIYLYNVSNGISITGNCARTTFGRIRGQPLINGIFIDGSMDILRFDSSIQFWPYWSGDLNVLSYTTLNSDPIVCLRCDGPMFNEVFVFGYHSGIHFGISGAGVTKGAMINSLIADSVKYGVWITGDNTQAMIGNLFTNGTDVTSASIVGSQSVRIESNGDFLQVGQWRSLTSGGSAAALTSTTGGSLFTVATVMVNSYNRDNTASPMVFAANSAGLQEINFGTQPYVTDGFGHINYGAPLVNLPTNALIGIPGFSTSSVTLASGGTASFPNFLSSNMMIIHSTGTLATATIVLPTAGAQGAGNGAMIVSDHDITSLAIQDFGMDPVWPINGCPSGLTAYRGVNLKWIEFGPSSGQWVCF